MFKLKDQEFKSKFKYQFLLRVPKTNNLGKVQDWWGRNANVTRSCAVEIIVESSGKLYENQGSFVVKCNSWKKECQEETGWDRWR